jgi:hypothetical protein
MPPHADHALRQRHTAWYRQPVVWLGAMVFAASIAGCIWIITAGMRHADTPVATSQTSVLGVPSSPQRAPQPATSAKPQ